MHVLYAQLGADMHSIVLYVGLPPLLVVVWQL